MKRIFSLAMLFLSASATILQARPDGGDDGTGAVCPGFSWDDSEELEIASLAVLHMGFGWNLGNTLDSNSGNLSNMWIEQWSNRAPSDYETAWGQPVTTRALIHLIKESGFGAVRVPVTWYPHMGTVNVSNGVWDMNTWQGTTVDAAWMARVREVVDYVIDEGMYCILNVHHDTGDATTVWLRADRNVFSQQQNRYEALWRQIANEFKSYDEHLLFEGYNEMLDTYGSWCFASFGAPGNYNATVASSAYDGINSYAQSFVNTVRKTGGNNTSRNLIVSTYGACCGGGNWSTHLQDPLRNMVLPTDSLSNHLIFEVHAYPSFTNLSQAKQAVVALLDDISTYLQPKAPVIIGEWGSGNSDVSYAKTQQLMCDFATYFCEQAHLKGIAPLYWMGISDGLARSAPELSEPLLVEAMRQGFGNTGNGMEFAKEKTDAKASKRIVDGRLLLVTGSNTYDASGQLITNN